MTLVGLNDTLMADGTAPDQEAELVDPINTSETQITTHMAVYCFLSTAIILVGVPANIMSLSYFILKEDSKVSKMIFVWLNSVDLFVCCWMIPQAVLNYSLGRIAFLKSTIYCSIRLAVYPTSLQLSIFITQLLCLTRTYSLMRPLGRIRKWLLKLCLGAFLVVILGRMASLFMKDELTVTYQEHRLRCAWAKPEGGAARFNIWNNILSCIMIIPTLFGCITSVLLLGCGRNVRENPLSKVKRDANVTVIIITIVCLVGYLQFLGMTFIDNFTGGVPVFVNNLSLIYACAAVSAINPIIYFLRIQRLREHVYWSLNVLFRAIKARLCRRDSRQRTGGPVRPGSSSYFDRTSISSSTTALTRSRTVVVKMVDIRPGSMELTDLSLCSPVRSCTSVMDPLPRLLPPSPGYFRLPGDNESVRSVEISVTEHETHLV